MSNNVDANILAILERHPDFNVEDFMSGRSVISQALFRELYLTHYETAHIPSKTIHGKFDLITELLAEEFGGGGAGETCIFLDRRNRFNY